MKIRIVFIALAMSCSCIVLLKSQTQSSMLLNENWMEGQRSFSENFDFKLHARSLPNSNLQSPKLPDFSEGPSPAETRIEQDGLLTSTNKKYFLLLKSLNSEAMADMPSAVIDPSKRYFILKKEVE